MQLERVSTVKRLLIIGSVCLLASTADGTRQVQEKLLHKGKEYRLACVPLEKYFDASHPKRLRQNGTACLRGYIGSWEVKGKKLYLKSLERFGPGLTVQEIPFSLVFEDQEPPVQATWYTGVLRMPHGERIKSVELIPSSAWLEDLYIGDGYHRRLRKYQKDLYLGIVRGNVVSEHLVDNTKEGSTRSVRDWGWFLSAPGPVKDDFKWHDLRTVASEDFSPYKELGKSFRTRGAYVIGAEKTMPRLWIPETFASPRLLVELKSVPVDFKVELFQHVEVKAHFEDEVAEHCILHVDSIRPLKPGETMHHPDFKPPAKPEQKKP
jgi:hypothetical protein